MSELMFKLSMIFSLVMPIINMHIDLSKSSAPYSCLRSSFIASYTLSKGTLLGFVHIILFTLNSKHSPETSPKLPDAAFIEYITSIG